MADRGLLHMNDVEPFAAWAQGKGWTRPPTKGLYEVLRLTRQERGGLRRITHVFFVRDRATQHVTVPESAKRLVRGYIEDKRRDP